MAANRLVSRGSFLNHFVCDSPVSQVSCSIYIAFASRDPTWKMLVLVWFRPIYGAASFSGSGKGFGFSRWRSVCDFLLLVARVRILPKTGFPIMRWSSHHQSDKSVSDPQTIFRSPAATEMD
jgi:hypothetical protein